MHISTSLSLQTAISLYTLLICLWEDASNWLWEKDRSRSYFSLLSVTYDESWIKVGGVQLNRACEVTTTTYHILFQMIWGQFCGRNSYCASYFLIRSSDATVCLSICRDRKIHFTEIIHGTHYRPDLNTFRTFLVSINLNLTKR